MKNPKNLPVFPFSEEDLTLNPVDIIVGALSMVAIKDLEHRYVFASRELEAFFGASYGEMTNTTLNDWVDEAKAKEIHSNEDSVVLSGEPTHFIEHFFEKEKKASRVIVRFPYRNQEGKIVGTGVTGIAIREGVDENSEMQHALKSAQHKIAQVQKSLEEVMLQATTDPLTGVWNRRGLQEHMQREITRFQRYEHPVSLIFIDVDHFKQVNDTWGHAIGDEVLKGFCQIISDVMRSTDLLGRWGGEEFILLTPNTGRMSARLVAERIRAALAEHHFDQVGQVTASFGVATCRQGESLEQWLNRADAATYRAKANGRDCIETDDDGMAADSGSEKISPNFVGLAWKSSYECGDALIDRQHLTLFEMSNQLLDAVLGGQPKGDVTDLINALLAEVVQHFSDEEAIFGLTEFPKSEEHHEIHQRLVAKAVHLAGLYAEDKLEIGELFSFLAYDVVAKHMLSEDREFFPYVGTSSLASPH